MNPDRKEITETAPKLSEDDAPNAAEGKDGETRTEAGNSSSDHAVASSSVDKHPSANDKTAARGEKRTFAQTADNEGGKGDKTEGLKKAKITANSSGPTPSAKNAADTSDKKSSVPFTPASFTGPTVILVFGVTARHEISIHKSLLSSNDYFDRRIACSVPSPDGRVRLSFLHHPKSAGEILRDFVYQSRLPWSESDVAVLKGKEAATVGAKILAAYILADEFGLLELQCPLLSLYKALQPSEIEWEAHMDTLDKAVGNPTDALRHVMQTNLDTLASSASTDLPKIARKKATNLVRWQMELVAQEKAKSVTRIQEKETAQKDSKSFTRDEAKKVAREGVENVTQAEVKHIAQETVNNVAQDIAEQGRKKVFREEVKNIAQDEMKHILQHEAKINAQQLQTKEDDESHRMEAMHQQECEFDENEEYLEALRRLEEDHLEYLRKLDKAAAENAASAPNATEAGVDNPSGSDPSTADTTSTHETAKSAALPQIKLLRKDEEENVPICTSDELANQCPLQKKQRGAGIVLVGEQDAMAADEAEEAPSTPAASEDLKSRGRAPPPNKLEVEEESVRATPNGRALKDAAAKVPGKTEVETEAEQLAGALPGIEAAKLEEDVPSK